VDRADYRPSGRSRGYASSEVELTSRAQALARHRAVYDEIVQDSLKRDATEKRSYVPPEVWDATAPPPPGVKSQVSRTRYENEEVPAYAFQSPKHPNDRRSNYGIGVPAAKIVQRPRPRRETRPHSVQDVPYPMNTYTDGPRELGNKIVRTYVGHVVSDKMSKTVAVEVSQYYRHPKYHKYIKTSRKFLTHDEEEECNVGDVVEIRVCRPLSRHKHFTLHKVLKPKLPIEVGAARFEEHMPAWKKPDLADEERAAVELQHGTEALQAEAKAREDAAKAEADKKAAQAARPALLEAAKKHYDELEAEAAAAAAVHAKLRDSLPPSKRDGDAALQQAHEEAVTKAKRAIEANEEVERIKGEMKPVVWASS